MENNFVKIVRLDKWKAIFFVVENENILIWKSTGSWLKSQDSEN